MEPARATLPAFIELAEVQDANMSTSSKDPGNRTAPKIDSRSAPATKSSQEQPGAPSPTGRIVHDSRGNAVWSWGKAGDSTATNSTSQMLKKLDIGDLRVQDEAQPEEQQQPDTKKRGSGYGPGYNPYDRTAPVRVTPPKKAPSR